MTLLCLGQGVVGGLGERGDQAHTHRAAPAIPKKGFGGWGSHPPRMEGEGLSWEKGLG